MLSRLSNAFSFFAPAVSTVTDLKECFQYKGDNCTLTYSAKTYLHMIDFFVNATGAQFINHCENFPVNFTYPIDCYDPNAQIACGNATSYDLAQDVERHCVDYIEEDLTLRCILVGLVIIGFAVSYKIVKQCIVNGSCDEPVSDEATQAVEMTIATLGSQENDEQKEVESQSLDVVQQENIDSLVEEKNNEGSTVDALGLPALTQVEMAPLHDSPLYELDDDQPLRISYQRMPSF